MRSVKSQKQPSQYLLDSFSLQGKRPSQEDNFLIMQSPWGDVLGLVADGLGGHAHGEFASSKVQEVFKHTFAQMNQFDSVESYIRKTLYVVVTMIMQQSMLEPEYKEAATTVSGFIITKQNEVFVFNIGDSRVYLFKEGHLKRLTTDHNMAQELVELGMITSEEALTHPSQYQLTNALSANLSDLRIDVEQKEPLLPGDMLIASTDGLHGYVSDRDIEQFLNNYTGQNSIAQELCQWAYDKGSEDNITAIVCQRII